MYYSDNDKTDLTYFPKRGDWKKPKLREKWAKEVFVPLVKKTKAQYGIELPYKFLPRDYQVDIVHAMLTKQMVTYCMHRRSGKDYMSVSMLALKAMMRVGNYVYLLPTAKQGREIVWKGIDNDGMKFIDHIPHELIKVNPKNKQPMVNNVEMCITLVNGSTITITGSDQFDKNLVGTNMAGIIFSEYSLSDPKAFEYILPIIGANNGFVWLNGTPRGKNHFYKQLMSCIDPDREANISFACIKPNSMTKALTEKELTIMKLGMSEQRQAQEIECAFEGCIEGKIYVEQITQARKEGRFGEYCYDKKLPVFVSFDLGVGDKMAMTFFQKRADRPWVIDFYSNKGMGVGHYKMVADDMSAKYGYDYERIFIPHDGRKRSIDNYDEEGYALKTEDTFRKEFKNIDIMVVPRCADITEDIEVVRSKFYKWYFYEGSTLDKAQKERLDYFYNAMSEYTYPEVDEQKTVATKPLHNWCSDPMDSWRTGVKAVVFGWCDAEMRKWLADLDEEHTDATPEEEYQLI